MAEYWERITSPICDFTVVVDANGVVLRIHLAADGTLPDPAGAERDPVRCHEATRQLSEYLAGRRRSFSLSVDPVGTDFQRRVWAAVGEIPFGRTSTYGAVAARLGDPKMVRAVGRANGANPIPILIPCHRVVGAGGDLVGYGGGLPLKAALLELEGARLPGDMQRRFDF